MKVIFYKCTDDRKKVIKKNKTEITAKDCDIKEPCTLLQPQILVSYSKDLLKANYIYIEDFNRYYFINNPTLETGGCLLFSCEADDLYNWQSYIKNKKFYIERQEKTFSSLIVDNEVPTFNDRVQIIKTLGTFGNTPTIYLNTTGGVQ